MSAPTLYGCTRHPLMIRVEIHNHVGPEPWAGPDWTGAIGAIEKYLVQHEMLSVRDEPNEFGQVFEGTDKLAAWVRALVNTPFPEAVWVVPNGHRKDEP